jgi:hypothetical protein
VSNGVTAHPLTLPTICRSRGADNPAMRIPWDRARDQGDQSAR